jgi:hypothetical protein
MTKARTSRANPVCAAPIGQIDPEGAAQQEGRDVNDHAFVERLDLVEEKFLAALFEARDKDRSPASRRGNRPRPG